MANQLDLARASRKAALYETIQFSEFHASMQGALTYRVNLSRAMWKEMTSIQAESAAVEELDKDSTERKEREKGVNERSLAFIASLIPRDSVGGEPITLAELKTFLEYAAETSEEEDVFFDQWLIDELMRRVGEYQAKHFLARVKSKNGSTPTPTPSTATAAQ